MAGRILFVITSLAYGGAEIQVKELAIRLRRRGWNVVVVSMCQPEALVAELEDGGVIVESLDMPRGAPDPRGVWKLARLIHKYQVQIVHSHMVHANLLARITRPLAPGRIWICTAHNIDEGGRNRERAYQLTDPLCHLTTQVSIAGMDRYIQVGATPQNKIIYLPNGVDAQQFHPDSKVRTRVRAALQLEERFVWLSIGRLEEAKDYPNLMRAFSLVTKDFPNTKLLIAGQGDMRPMLETLRNELEIDEQVSFLGVRNDVPALMNAADAFVISSAWEGLPMVLLEAAATGLPLVATDVGGVNEIVINGKNGFLRPPYDAPALADAMTTLMALTPAERETMGKASRELVLSTYELEQVVTHWEALYRRLLSGKHAPEGMET